MNSKNKIIVIGVGVSNVNKMVLDGVKMTADIPNHLTHNHQ